MNVIITSDNLQRTLTVNLRGWRAPAALLAVVAVLAYATYRNAFALAERWALERDPRVAHIVRQQLAEGTAERNALWQSSVARLQQEVTELQVRLWRISALGNEIARRLDLGAEVMVPVGRVPPTVPPPGSRAPSDEISMVESRLIELGAAARAEAVRLDQIGANTSALAMLRATVPMRRPVEGRYWLTSGFGTRKDPFTGRRAFHAGYDFAARTGTPALAAADGIVTHRGRLGNYGKLVEIYHGDGISTLYGHLHDYRVEVGDFVTRGDVIGLVGSTGRSTGPHLHYEVRKDGKPRPYTKLIGELLEERPMVAVAPPADLLLN